MNEADLLCNKEIVREDRRRKQITIVKGKGEKRREWLGRRRN